MLPSDQDRPPAGAARGFTRQIPPTPLTAARQLCIVGKPQFVEPFEYQAQ
jgi:hypothetical protein